MQTRIELPDLRNNSQKLKIDLTRHMLGLSQSIRNKKKDSSREVKVRKREKRLRLSKCCIQECTEVTIIQGLTVITFPIYLDLLILKSLWLSVLEIPPI